jgi:NADPH:quinone reductase-like Zn-dependent oxidoreductase
MRAVVQHEYGDADVLQLEDVETPRIRDDQLLLKVVAASVHAGDALLMQGIPYVMRLGTGVARPRRGIRGLDVAGIVDEVGSRVTRFAEGDEVFGNGTGTLAEWARAKPKQLTSKPASLSFEQAAVLTVSGLTALRAIRDVGAVQAGQSVLVNGASGGVGVYAVQIAKALGADVTGVCGTRNVDLVRSLGADHVVDYRASDFTESGQRYDVILDNVGNKPLADCLRVLAPHGTLMPNSGTSGGSWLGSLPTMGHAAVRSVFSPQKTTTFLSMPNPDDLEALKDLVLSGAVRPVISGTYPLDQAAEAMRVVQSGHTSGKVVVQVAAQGSVAGEPPQPE